MFHKVVLTGEKDSREQNTGKIKIQCNTKKVLSNSMVDIGKSVLILMHHDVNHSGLTGAKVIATFSFSP